MSQTSITGPDNIYAESAAALSHPEAFAIIHEPEYLGEAEHGWVSLPTEERLMRLYAAEKRLRENNHKEAEEVFMHVSSERLDLKLEKLENKEGLSKWKLKGKSDSNYGINGTFLDSDTLSKLFDKGKEGTDMMAWIKRREEELFDVLIVMQAQERSLKCYNHKIFRNKFTARCCCCMPWGGIVDDNKTGCCCLKKRLMTDVEIRLQRLYKEEEMLRKTECTETEYTGNNEYNRLHYRLEKSEGKWKLTGPTKDGTTRDMFGFLVKIKSDVLSAILAKKECDWTREERRKVLAWLQYREGEIISQAIKPQAINPEEESARPEEESAPPCLGLGIFYKDSKDGTLDFQWYDLLIGVFGILLYMWDIVSDILVATKYVLEKKYTYFGLTIGVVVLAYVVNALMTLHIHLKGKYFVGKQWILDAIGLVCNMGPSTTSAVYLYYGCKSRQTGLTYIERKDYVNKSIARREDSFVLRQYEGFLEAAPQLIIQLCVFAMTTEISEISVMQWLAALSSWFSLSLTLASFSKANRLKRTIDSLYKSDLSGFLHVSFDCLRRMAETGGRVLCIALFVSEFGFWVLVPLLLHFVIMALWYYCLNAKSCSKLGVILSMAFFSIFAFWPWNHITQGNIIDNSRVRYLVAWVIFCIENVTMLVIWSQCSNPVDWVRIWGHWACITFIVLHPVLMLLYYGLCHPKSHYIRDKGREAWLDREVWRESMLGNEG